MDLGIGSLDLCNWRLGVVFGFGFLFFYLVAEKILDRNCKDTKFSRNCV